MKIQFSLLSPKEETRILVPIYIKRTKGRSKEDGESEKGAKERSEEDGEREEGAKGGAKEDGERE